MKSVRFSSDIHYVNKSKVVGGDKETLVLQFEDCHEVFCDGEENAIERLTTDRKEVTCFLCLQKMNTPIDELVDWL